jgi:hypothetical protein
MTMLLKGVAVVMLIAAFVVIWTGLTTNLGIVERTLVLALGGLLVWGATLSQRRAT